MRAPPPDAARDPWPMLAGRARPVTLPAGHTVFAAGVPCPGHVLLRTGRVRVHALDAEGHEIVLYRLGPGDACVLNTAALLAGEPYAAHAVTETPVEALLLAVCDFDALIAGSPAFRARVFQAHGARVAALVQRVQAIAFDTTGRRLAGCLLVLAGEDDHVATTHAALAVEVGTAREVVSRTLKRFADRGWVRATPGDVAILSRSGLVGEAAGGAA